MTVKDDTIFKVYSHPLDDLMVLAIWIRLSYITLNVMCSIMI